MVRADRKYRFDRLRCIGCRVVGKLQFRGYRPRIGGTMLTAKCKSCGRLNHVQEEKALA